MGGLMSIRALSDILYVCPSKSEKNLTQTEALTALGSV